jgi:hypothetical protein
MTSNAWQQTRLTLVVLASAGDVRGGTKESWRLFNCHTSASLELNMAESQLVNPFVLRSPKQPKQKRKVLEILLQVRLSGTTLIARLTESRRTAVDLSMSSKLRSKLLINDKGSAKFVVLRVQTLQ